MTRTKSFAVASVLLLSISLGAQAPRQPDWVAIEKETLEHFQAVLRIDTSAGGERRVADYLKAVFDREGIPADVLARDPNRANIVARLKGSGARRPLLILGHSDVVTVDAAKGRFPPFSATRDGGYVYGRGALDDKDNLTASLMTMLLLKRLNVPLDRDVIFVSEAGEEGQTAVGIDFLIDQHFPAIDAEACLAEGGSTVRSGGAVRYVSVQTAEKVPRGVVLVARGAAGHGSVPLKTNPIVRLAAAVARIGAWRPEIRLNETTSTHFRRLAEVSPSEPARYYRDVASPDPAVRAAADDWLFEHQPAKSSMLRTSVSPNIFTAGYRYNVIPSEATAELDIRMLPDEDEASFMERVRQVINDPLIELRPPSYETRRPFGQPSRLDSDIYRAIESAATRIYNASTVPTMSTGASDMAQLRAKGIQCYGIGPGVDEEDAPAGFGSHSDQERILESELHRFVRFTWEIVTNVVK